MTIDIEGPPLRKFDLDVAYKECNNENRRAKTWTICLYLRFKNSAGYKHLTEQCKGKDGMKLFYPNFLTQCLL